MPTDLAVHSCLLMHIGGNSCFMMPKMLWVGTSLGLEMLKLCFCRHFSLFCDGPKCHLGEQLTWFWDNVCVLVCLGLCECRLFRFTSFLSIRHLDDWSQVCVTVHKASTDGGNVKETLSDHLACLCVGDSVDWPEESSFRPLQLKWTWWKDSGGKIISTYVKNKLCWASSFLFDLSSLGNPYFCALKQVCYTCAVNNNYKYNSIYAIRKNDLLSLRTHCNT